MFENNYKTAIVRKGVSQPVRRLLRYGTIYPNRTRDIINFDILDFGCGKGFDAGFLGCHKFDPYYFPSEELNPNGYSIILCTYVLNVVSEEDQHKILDRIASLLRNDGIVYISLRRDIPQEGTQTQRWVELPYPPFRRYTGNGKYIIYYAGKANLLEYQASKATTPK